MRVRLRGPSVWRASPGECCREQPRRSTTTQTLETAVFPSLLFQRVLTGPNLPWHGGSVLGPPCRRGPRCPCAVLVPPPGCLSPGTGATPSRTTVTWLKCFWELLHFCHACVSCLHPAGVPVRFPQASHGGGGRCPVHSKHLISVTVLIYCHCLCHERSSLPKRKTLELPFLNSLPRAKLIFISCNILFLLLKRC